MAKTVVLRWTIQREWRVAVPLGERDDSAIARAMEEAVNASGIFRNAGLDPYSIEFQVEDK